MKQKRDGVLPSLFCCSGDNLPPTRIPYCILGMGQIERLKQKDISGYLEMFTDPIQHITIDPHLQRTCFQFAQSIYADSDNIRHLFLCQVVVNAQMMKIKAKIF